MGYCKYCDVERVNMSVHDMSMKHMKLKQLYTYLDSLDDIHEKQNTLKLIETIKIVKNKSRSDKYKDYRMRYYQEHVKGKYNRIREPDQNPCYLISKTEIIRDDGTIEYQEIWRERNCRFSRNHKKNNIK